jgi:molybdopterin-containing oxidoreductase family membrane subunit
MIYFGTMGLFTFLFFLFVRFLPMIPMSEIRTMLPQTKITRGGKNAETVSQESA